MFPDLVKRPHAKEKQSRCKNYEPRRGFSEVSSGTVSPVAERSSSDRSDLSPWSGDDVMEVLDESQSSGWHTTQRLCQWMQGDSPFCLPPSHPAGIPQGRVSVNVRRSVCTDIRRSVTIADRRNYNGDATDLLHPHSPFKLQCSETDTNNVVTFWKHWRDLT